MFFSYELDENATPPHHFLGPPYRTDTLPMCHPR